MNHLMNTYGRLPVSFTHGEGAYLHDTEGRTYLDALTGIAVTGLGHAHPRVTAAINEQAQKLLHTSNLYEIPLQTRLADRLCNLSGMDRVFFCNSGAEANEAAIKMARLKGSNDGIKSPATIVMSESFHGRTMATLTATGNRKAHAGFEPLLSGFLRAPFDDLEAVAKIAADNPNAVAVFVEPIQGEGGIHIPSADYLSKLRQICDTRNLLMMLDEVQSGNGRTGTYFAYQHSDCLPDVVTTAKGLGNGVPIGACLARGAAAELFAPGNHGSTFGGNPLACAAALAVLDTLEEQSVMANAAEKGEWIVDRLRTALSGDNNVREVRGKGMMIGIELNHEVPKMVADALAEGLLINVTQGKIIRLLPPLTLTQTEAEELTDKLLALITS